MDFDTYLRYWKNRISRDLSPFSDPGTTVQVEAERGTVYARWTSRTEEAEASFRVSLDRGISVQFNGRTLTYRSFLASEKMADLRQLARMILQTSQGGLFIETKARIPSESGEEGTARPATTVLNELLASPPALDLTNIVFVTGDAGAGKTSVLKELVRQRAKDFDEGQAGDLLLYVDAQGRALARFNEALASELDDLRASITYHAVATLVRAGVLIPVIDGFDELLGAGGYDDAFNSLAGFLEELSGEGQIVAAARSTYYELEFASRANTSSSLGEQAWALSPVHIEDWDRSQRGSYIKAVQEDGKAISHEIESRIVDGEGLSAGNRELLSKPFFVVRIAELLLSGEDVSDSPDLLDQLVDSYCHRELNKLVDRTGAPYLTIGQLRSLMTTVAEEMWNQQTRELDPRSMREVAEYVLVDELMSDSAREAVIAQMPKLALFSLGTSQGRVAFEHEMFFSYFLAHALRLTFERSAVVVQRAVLSRSRLPVEVARRFAWDSVGSQDDARSLLADLTSVAGGDERRAAQVRQNAGTIALEVALRRVEGEGVARNLAFQGLSLVGLQWHESRFEECRFHDVSIQGCNLSGAQLVRCSATQLVFTEVLVDPQRTRLEVGTLGTHLRVFGVRVRERGNIHPVYAPNEMRSVLKRCGVLVPEAEKRGLEGRVDPEVVALVDRLVRAYSRANPICVSDDTMRHIFRSPYWEQVESLLIRHGLVVPEYRETGGPPKRFLRRRFLPEQLMGDPDSGTVRLKHVQDFWADLRSEFPLTQSN